MSTLDLPNERGVREQRPAGNVHKKHGLIYSTTSDPNALEVGILGLRELRFVVHVPPSKVEVITALNGQDALQQTDRNSEPAALSNLDSNRERCRMASNLSTRWRSTVLDLPNERVIREQRSAGIFHKKHDLIYFTTPAPNALDVGILGLQEPRLVVHVAPSKVEGGSHRQPECPRCPATDRREKQASGAK